MDEEKSMVANAMPPSISDTQTSQGRRPSNLSNFSGTERFSIASTFCSARLSTPPIDLTIPLPVPPSPIATTPISPATAFHRSPSVSTPRPPAPATRRPIPQGSTTTAPRSPVSPGTTAPTSPPATLRPRLFTAGSSNTASPYQEPIAWANSTRFRNTYTTTNTTTSPTADGLKPSPQSHSLHSPRLSRSFATPRSRTPWRAGKLVRFPWKGATALALAVFLNAMAVVIVLVAGGSGKGKEPREWKASVQPQVLLSLLEVLSLVALGVGFLEGLAVVFWGVLGRGCAVSDIHDIYASTSPWTAIRLVSRLRCNPVAIATLTTLLSLAKGPLFQRSLTPTSTTSYTTSPTPLLLATLLSLASPLSLLPLYTCYSTHGRAPSLHPLEIARAFAAPVFDGLDGNISAKGISAERGEMRIRYGVVERFGGEKVLRVEDARVCSVRMGMEGEVCG